MRLVNASRGSAAPPPAHLGFESFFRASEISHVHTSIHTYIYIYMCIHMQTHIKTCVYIYTHIHARPRPPRRSTWKTSSTGHLIQKRLDCRPYHRSCYDCYCNTDVQSNCNSNDIDDYCCGTITCSICSATCSEKITLSVVCISIGVFIQVAVGVVMNISQ